MADIKNGNIQKSLKNLQIEIDYFHNTPKYINQSRINEVWERLEELIDFCHISLESFVQADSPKQWEENQNALDKLQQLVAEEIERERLIVKKSDTYQKLQKSQEIGRSMHFQDRKFFDFRAVGISDCSIFDYADLSGANLSGTRTNRTRLRYAKLIDADLSKVCWRNLHLTGADLSYANLQDAIISGDLNHANLSHANLSNTNLYYTSLVGTNFNNANVTNTEFSAEMHLSIRQDLIARGAIFVS